MRAPGGSVVLSAPAATGSGTVADSIGASRHRVRVAAATAAGAHNFIAELPEGYDTPLGNGGFTLTPAQQLRLTVARLLADGTAAVVLDDPTRDLDAAGEAAVLPGLETLLRDRQVSVVAASPAVRAVVARTARPGADPHTDPADHDMARAPAVGPLPADPGLSQLRQLLDASHMAPLLGRALGADIAPDVRVQSVRYKPGDNAVVQYAVGTGHHWCTAVAYARSTGHLARKPRRRRNRAAARHAAPRSPAREPFGYLPDVSALVQWLPLDVRLPLLSLSAKQLNRRLTQSGLAPVEDAKPKLLRYWPRRRAVVRFGPYVLKTYRDPRDYAEAAQGLRTSQHLGRVRTPVFEGILDDGVTTVQRHVKGDSPSLRPGASEPAGALLARLHAESAPDLQVSAPADILAKSAVRAQFVGYLRPELRGDLDHLLALLSATIPRDLRFVVSHGNFYAGQLLQRHRHLVLIDVDRMCLSAPAYDLASFAAHVAFGRPGEMDLVATALDSVVAGYGSRPKGLEWFLANCLLRRAAVPFRYQDEHWPEAVANLVASARGALR
jgi:hypothetical protein